MISSIGSSQNVRLIPSGRDEWSVGWTVASSMRDDKAVTCAKAVKFTRSKHSTRVFDRSPHSLRLDGNRVAYGFNNLYNIPEDEAVCEYRTVVWVEPLESEVVTANNEAIHFQTLQNEPLKHEAKPKEASHVDKAAVGWKEIKPLSRLFGLKRSYAWDSDQFNSVLQVLEEECLERK